MMKLKAQQYEAFVRKDEEEYRTRLEAFLREQLPNACAARGDAALEGHVVRQIARARAHGFETERQIAQFTVLSLMFGEGFDQRCSWAELALDAAAHLSPDERLDRLSDVAEQHLSDAPHRD